MQKKYINAKLEKFLKRILGNINESICAVDEAGNLIYWNKPGRNCGESSHQVFYKCVGYGSITDRKAY